MSSKRGFSSTDVPDAVLGRPIFGEVSDDIEEGWIHGAIVGGLAEVQSVETIARAYRDAGDALIEQALSKRLSWEIVHPVLFLYRHAIELGMKAALQDARYGHGLRPLANAIKRRLPAAPERSRVRASFEARIRELIAWDPRSTAFRYSVRPAKSSPLSATRGTAELHPPPKPTRKHPLGEAWVDLRQLRESVGAILSVVEFARRAKRR